MTEPKPVDFKPRPGALRYIDEYGKTHSANPRDPMYSTVSMLATEFWDGKAWVRVDAA